jgi:hypothetical protein
VPQLRRLLPAVVLAITVVVSGCGSTGTAARVGDETIMIGDLQSQVVEFSDSLDEPLATGGDLSSFQRELLTREINHLLLAELAEREGVEVSEAEVDGLLDELAAQAEAQGGLDALRAQFGYTDEGLRRAALDELRLRQLEPVVGDIPTALTGLSAEIGVEVNPRYGSWDGSSLEPGTGSISVPAGPETG